MKCCADLLRSSVLKAKVLNKKIVQLKNKMLPTLLRTNFNRLKAILSHAQYKKSLLSFVGLPLKILHAMLTSDEAPSEVRSYI